MSTLEWRCVQAGYLFFRNYLFNQCSRKVDFKLTSFLHKIHSMSFSRKSLGEREFNPGSGKTVDEIIFSKNIFFFSHIIKTFEYYFSSQLQDDPSCTRIETRRTNTSLFFKTHRKYSPYCIHLLHRFWHLWSSGNYAITFAAKALRWRVKQLLKCLIKKENLSS